MTDETVAGSRRTRVWAVLIALLLTVFGALKPMTIDETVYQLYARQIVAHPLDPLGFQVLWNDAYEPALDVLVPPGLPHWLAAGIALFGSEPWRWKLWLFPPALLFCLALRSLLARYAPGSETPLLFAIALAPTVVPAFNLMLDLPALALGLAAVALFASERAQRSTGLVLVAGAAAGLALLTKYTALAPLLALLVLGWRRRRVVHALLAGATAAALFLAWEGWLTHLYGESQFLHAVGARHAVEWSPTPGEAVVGWLALFGCLGLPAALLALVALGGRTRALLPALVLASAPFAWIAALAPRYGAVLLRPTHLGSGDRELDLFFALGLGVVPLVAAGVVAAATRASPGRRGDARFLAIWLALELACTLALSPYLAARRVIGTLLVASLALGAAAAERPGSGPALRLVAAWTAVLGLLFGTADLLDARARESVQAPVAARLAQLGYDPSVQRVWFVGHWGFRFYAERRGYRPLAGGDSELREGDFVLTNDGVHRQRLPAAFQDLVSKPLAKVQAGSPFPWSTTPSAYLGAVPLRRQPHLQLQVRIHRVEKSGRLPPAEP